MSKTSTLRPAGVATRAAIAEAARSLFGDAAYDAVSVRAIAAAAGVDPALVIRHFGSKEALFLHTVATGSGLGEVVEGPLEGLGEALVRYFLGRSGNDFRHQFIALVQASHHEHLRAELQRHTAETFLGPIASRLRGERAELRAALVVAQVGGLLNLMVLHEDPTLRAASHEDLVEVYGACLQRLIDG